MPAIKDSADQARSLIKSCGLIQIGATCVLIFKICHWEDWENAKAEGICRGSPKDIADGFLHFSKAEQLQGTLTRYYANSHDLILIAVESDELGTPLKFESSRDGALFPHLYANLPVSAALWTAPITTDAEGAFVIPDKVWQNSRNI